MEFTNCLFIANATTGSVLPFKRIWGRINTIELKAHCIAPSHRIARYTVQYWLNDPLVNVVSEAAPLTLLIDGLPQTEFHVEVPITITSISDIERLCVQDLMQQKLLGNDNSLIKRYVYNLGQRLKRIDGYTLKASNPTTNLFNDHFVKAIEHLTVITGNNRDPLVISKSVVIVTDLISSTELNIDYTPDADWVRSAAKQWVSPNTLRAIKAQRNSYQ